MEKKKLFPILILLLLLLGILIFFLFGRSNESNQSKTLLPVDEDATEWNGNQNVPTGTKTESKTIKIPGFKSLAFTADEKEQRVNFYNPEENTCLFRMTLFIEDEQYWQSGYVSPGNGYYNISLENTLSIGDYNAYLEIECFEENGKALNGAKVEFELKVVEK